MQRLGAAALLTELDRLAMLSCAVPEPSKTSSATRKVASAAPKARGSTGMRAAFTAAVVVAALALVVGSRSTTLTAGQTTPPPKPELPPSPLSALVAKRTHDDNAEAAARVALGRLLYFDTALSAPTGRPVSCSTCHILEAGGTTAEGLTNQGSNGERAGWNTPTVFNASVVFRQSWKADAETIEAILERPLTKPELMGKQELTDIPPRLQRWAPEFAAADLALDEHGFRTALAAYVKHLEPRDSAFDRSLRNEQGLDADAERGRQAFLGLGCVGCHQGEGIGGNMVQRFGVMPNVDPYGDRGVCAGDRVLYCRSDASCADLGPCVDVGKSPLRDRDKTDFRVASLRNVALTAPYFHDGSAATLEDAVTVMARLQLGRVLSKGETDDLVAFLRSLTGTLPPGELELVEAARKRAWAKP